MNGGKKGGTPKIPNYYVGIHFVLCHGPIDKITQIFCDTRSAWQGNQGQGSLYFDQSNLFGGISREGGIKGTLDVCLGGLAQTANAYLQSKEVNPISSFRGICSIVLNQFYVGQNYYLKPWSFLATRLHVRHYTGTTQWFDAYAEVPSPSIYTYNNNINANLLSITNVGSVAICNFDGDHTFTSGATTAEVSPGLLVTVSGATDNLYNGTFKVLSSNYINYL